MALAVSDSASVFWRLLVLAVVLAAVPAALAYGLPVLREVRRRRREAGYERLWWPRS